MADRKSGGGETGPRPDRLVSLDAYRGFIMLVMASSSLAIPSVAKTHFQGQPAWQFLAFHTEHVDWIGCSFWDLIQPSFMFMVGVALAFSRANRISKGETNRAILLHSLWRSLILILLAVFLSSTSSKETNWIFPNVLAQIGLGYTFLALLAMVSPAKQLVALLLILAGTTAAFGLFPAPGPEFDWKAHGVSADWHHLEGWFSHWNKNSNIAAAFDRWFLNLFPRPSPFLFNDGGYATLNFIPSLATMLMGLMAGQFLRQPGSRVKQFLFLVVAGFACLGIGLFMGNTVCPIVKRIWTPSWAVYSTGWTFLMLAFFFGVIECIGWKNWAFPFVVVGMNSIAIYCMSQLSRGFVRNSLNIHLGKPVAWLVECLKAPELITVYGPIFQNAAILLVFWLVCFWLYRRQIFLKI